MAVACELCGKETTERKYRLKGRFEKPTELGRIMETLVGEQSTDGNGILRTFHSRMAKARHCHRGHRLWLPPDGIQSVISKPWQTSSDSSFHDGCVFVNSIDPQLC